MDDQFPKKMVRNPFIGLDPDEQVFNPDDIPKNPDTKLPLCEVENPIYSFENLYLSEDQRIFFSRIVSEYRNIEIINRLKLFPIQKILILGEPGTGKIAIGHALANELDFEMVILNVENIFCESFTNSINTLKIAIEYIKNIADCSLANILLLIPNIEILVGYKNEKIGHNDNNLVNQVLNQHFKKEIQKLPKNIFLLATCHQQINSSIASKFEECIKLHNPDDNQRRNIICNEFKNLNLKLNIDLQRAVQNSQGLNFKELEVLILDFARKNAIEDYFTDEDFYEMILRKQLEILDEKDLDFKQKILTLQNLGFSHELLTKVLNMTNYELELLIQDDDLNLGD